MRALVLCLLVVAACGDSDITPDPTGTGGSTSNSPNTTSNGAGGQGGDGDGAGGQVPALGYENGDRLRAKTLVGADGSKQFYFGWRDTELDIDCSFRGAEDGTIRCLPTKGANILYFSDAACTAPLLLPGCEGATGEQVTVSLPDAPCGQVKQQVHRLGTAFAGSTVYVFNDVAGCTASAGAPPPGLFTSAVIEPASKFVEATAQVD